MFLIEIDNINMIKTIFNSIVNIIDTARIEADKEGIRLNAMDRAHITFIHLELKEETFFRYMCDEPTTITIDTIEFMKILKRAKNNDYVLLQVDEGNLIITYNGEATRTFKIRLIDDEYDSPEPPRIEQPVNIETPVTVLKDMINDVKLYGDKIRLQADEDYLYGSSDGEFGEAQSKYSHGERVNGAVKSSFSIGAIEDMLRAEKLSDTVKLGLGNNTPLTLKYMMDDGELSFLLAPRIEEE